MLGAGGATLNHPATNSGDFSVKNWWRKWSYEIPLIIGDVLWEALVVRFAAFLDRLTVRKVFGFLVIAVLVMAFIQTLPIDLAILFAGDTLMYLEFLVALRLAAGKLHALTMLRQALRLARFAMRILTAAISIPVSRLSRLRERRSVARSAKPRRKSDSSDDERGFGVAWGMPAAA
jgi:hypothetical protein